LVAACAAPATPAPTATPAATPTAEPLTFTDGLGRAVTLAGPAQRIITLAPSNTELLFAVGAGGQMAGRDELSDYPPEAQDVASIGSTYGALNTELIVSLKPDLVLLAEVNTPENVKTLEDLGLTVFYLSNPVDFDGLYANVLTIGRLTGRTAEAEALAASLRARVEAVLAKTSAVTDHPKVFYEIDATDPTKPFTVGAGTFMDTLLTLAGGENVGAALESPYPQISSEELVKQDPALILLGDAAYGVTPESVAARPGWEALTAVKTNQIAAFDDNLVSRPGPRLVDGLELLAKLLHPELFQ
ncbi:MAG: cobalamin-binding protein, partial [Anaerolineales bacterium]|nr:cobalamin-binding protein [Anaerolineales bacterium]